MRDILSQIANSGIRDGVKEVFLKSIKKTRAVTDIKGREVQDIFNIYRRPEQYSDWRLESHERRPVPDHLRETHLLREFMPLLTRYRIDSERL